MISRGTKVTLAIVALLFGLIACGRDEPETPGISDEPRVASDQGTVTEVDDRRIVLDEKRSYPISPQVESFKTHAGHEVTAVVNWKNKYVHIGIEDEAVVWIAGIGITIPGNPRTVIYSGVLEEAGDNQLTFKDGTVLKTVEGLAVPKPGGRVVATIDADRHLVTELARS